MAKKYFYEVYRETAQRDVKVDELATTDYDILKMRIKNSFPDGYGQVATFKDEYETKHGMRYQTKHYFNYAGRNWLVIITVTEEKE